MFTTACHWSLSWNTSS